MMSKPYKIYGKITKLNMFKPYIHVSNKYHKIIQLKIWKNESILDIQYNFWGEYNIEKLSEKDNWMVHYGCLVKNT